jgi:hypothetical protein
VISAAEDGRTTFKASAEGKHRNLVPGEREKTLQAFVELASTKPVPRRGRRGG